MSSPILGPYSQMMEHSFQDYLREWMQLGPEGVNQDVIQRKKSNELFKKIILFSATENDAYWFSSALKSSQDLIQDISSNTRNYIAVSEGFKNSPSDPAMGITASFGMLWGSVGAKQSLDEVSNALKERDLGKLSHNFLELVRNLLACVSSFVNTVQRGTKIASLIETIEGQYRSAAKLTEVVKVLEGAADGLFGILYGFTALVHGVKLHRSKKFLKQFQANHPATISEQDLELFSRELQQYINFLKKKLTLKMFVSELDGRPIDAAQKKAEQVWGKKIPLNLDPKARSEKINTEIDNEFYQEGLKEAIKGLRHLLEVLEMPWRSKDKCKQLVESVFSQQELVAEGKKLRLQQLQNKKEKKLLKFLSAAQVEFLKQEKPEHSLSKRLISVDSKERQEAIEQAKTMVKSVKQSSEEAVVIHSIMVVCGVIALLVTIIFPPLGAGAILGGSLLFIVSITMLALDIRSFQHDMKSKQFAKHDQKILIASSILCLLAMITALTITLFFSFGSTSLLLLIIAGTWLGVNIYTMYQLKKNRFELEKLSPSLQVFQRVLSAKNSTEEEVKNVFARLAKPHREKITYAIWQQHAPQGMLENEADQGLDRNANFGYEFLQKYPLHRDVKEAAALAGKQHEKEQLLLIEEEKILKDKFKASLTAFLR